MWIIFENFAYTSSEEHKTGADIIRIRPIRLFNLI